ncbi:cytochrome c-type biogenesis protein CcmH [Salmonella enterica subsp. arizonae serovar 18:z4,z23:-]|uniref:Cytochrome c-type biogenesis protein n=5 Tax=Salmonella enterica TaxID=28901 RepID=A0A5W4F2T8_SALER|nr:cytochrome c-type biogenesis protein CcmH [Salmonella enterica subsp. arizonae serovar 18:z4,z23:-]EBV9432831.1 cytochrome c-type biogenesis protein CcmH [Salmonella enterica subsp. enterica serovar Heidelberg]ECE0610229.1 cytochrome c-type biogenesis protein CcmH [Salmonella enterica subsp. arizonae]EEC5496476.1 cytochrome c-type biogenesis protein CcmH [Salmonella enterica]OLY39318.1 heme lyase subunit CcmH [Salmonella enterica subsp. arizonae serovar 18:z4,z23:- str. CVM 32457]PNV37871.1
MRFLLGALMLLVSGSALATIDVMPFKDEAQEQQFRQLTEQLRCPKCQNNSIADSGSMIATDLRQKVYELIQEGKSNKEIVDYMVARYGNFVTYDPPLTPLTILLWVLPAAAVGAGGWIIFARSRRRVRLKQEEFSDAVPADGKRAGSGAYVPGIVIALIVAAISYYQTGSYGQVKIWRQATALTPVLLERVLDPKAQPLNEEEMARLALGLRTRLQNDAGNVEGWLMLGRIGMVLGNAGTATGAYANAYRLDPKNSDAALGYAEALTRSSDPEDNRRGGELLRRLVRSDHTDIRVLSLYAFNAFEQGRFGEAVAAWEMMLKLLPAADPRRAVIERSIRQALAQEK